MATKKKKLDTFLLIRPRTGDLSLREWADKFWDTYGFDFDTERIAKFGQLWVWANGVELDELKENLAADEIGYFVHEFDSDMFFGLDIPKVA